jgi:hypothetical protein
MHSLYKYKQYINSWMERFLLFGVLSLYIEAFFETLPGIILSYGSRKMPGSYIDHKCNQPEKAEEKNLLMKHF